MTIGGADMTMTEAKKRALMKYSATHIKQTGFKVQKTYFENVLKPAVEAAGESMNGFIKKAIDQRIEREGLLNGKNAVEPPDTNNPMQTGTDTPDISGMLL